MRIDDLYFTEDFLGNPYVAYITYMETQKDKTHIDYCKITKTECVWKHGFVEEIFNFDNLHFLENRYIPVSQISNLHVDFPEVFL